MTDAGDGADGAKFGKGLPRDSHGEAAAAIKAAVGPGVFRILEKVRVQQEYQESPEAEKAALIIRTCVPRLSTPAENPLRILLVDILSVVDDLKAAQSLLESKVSAARLRLAKNNSDWEASATAKEIRTHKDGVVFYEHTLTGPGLDWECFIRDCVRYSLFEATDEELTDFIAAYARLPSGFQSAQIPIDETLIDRAREIRARLEASPK